MKKILIVDDATTVRMYHRQLMESIGYQVEEAGNGLEALERINQESFDLLLVDINMPKMDGYTFIEEVRKTPDVRATPAIMISTEETEQDQDKAYAAGANFYLVKPVRIEALQTYAELLTGGVQ
ncbi:MAG: two-component system response regulator [Marinomonas sp.]|jgi:two-component system chemotaxis response regulator CheY|uniref:Two-component system chemotaxis response regulator CheY n=1 Tax=Marinomonas communis TaxID=28254 RepID=A0A4R6XCR4_9GAMM|nr:response regulator [Marinomonas communis]MAF16973.1 two-component system response regulator [Marinomonas sp.]MEC8081528.1 response regulator [Pseudomonadota bacterium]MCC4275760.1 response regulator [Marinomonas communis]RUM52419.1 MAG: response regulator [Marinomonas sp.]RUM53966.1 MAG: response regulator [Marinomonas sp.]